jgi:hypothetical protein
MRVVVAVKHPPIADVGEVSDDLKWARRARLSAYHRAFLAAVGCSNPPHECGI